MLFELFSITHWIIHKRHRHFSNILTPPPQCRKFFAPVCWQISIKFDPPPLEIADVILFCFPKVWYMATTIKSQAEAQVC